MAGPDERIPADAAGETFRAPAGAEGAAAWRARLAAEDAGAADRAAFRSWLDENPSNREAFERLETLWTDIEPLKASGLVRRALKNERRAAARRRALLWAPGLAAAAALAFGVFVLRDAGSPEGDGSLIRTGVGERRVVALSDGSVVTLNTASAVETMITPSARRIRLIEGQAAFDVRADAARPFVVVAGPAAVTATGTKFDVYRRGGAVEVTLIEGTVDVTGVPAVGAPPEPRRPRGAVLAPGEQILVAADGRLASAAQVDIETVTDWREGRAYFRDTPLAAAIEEMNRYSEERIILADSSLAGRSISGVFRVGDNERFIGALALLFHLRAEEGPQSAVILSEAAL